jgi:hypothetical protein
VVGGFARRRRWIVGSRRQAAAAETWRGQIVDGRHREKLCRELNVEPRYLDISTLCPIEADMRKHVTALNQHRRARTTPLTNKEKRMKIAEELKANPDRSDREIAEAAGVSHTSVQQARRGWI